MLLQLQQFAKILDSKLKDVFDREDLRVDFVYKLKYIVKQIRTL